MLRFMMMGVALVLASLIITQLLLPAAQGRLLFPLFRGKIRKAEFDLAEQKTAKRIKLMEASTIRLDHENQQHVHEALDELIEDEEQRKVKDE